MSQNDIKILIEEAEEETFYVAYHIRMKLECLFNKYVQRLQATIVFTKKFFSECRNISRFKCNNYFSIFVPFLQFIYAYKLEKLIATYNRPKTNTSINNTVCDICNY